MQITIRRRPELRTQVYQFLKSLEIENYTTFSRLICFVAFPLLLHHAAASLHILTSYPAGSVTREKSGYVCHLLGRTYTIKR
jgi:hypothetical protein